MTASRILTVNDSSNILEIEYDHVVKTMTVSFSNGSVYKYTDVGAPVFGALASAESVGSTLNKWINFSTRNYERIK